MDLWGEINCFKHFEDAGKKNCDHLPQYFKSRQSYGFQSLCYNNKAKYALICHDYGINQ